jgi:hypothetical protein
MKHSFSILISLIAFSFSSSSYATEKSCLDKAAFHSMHKMIIVVTTRNGEKFKNTYAKRELLEESTCEYAIRNEVDEMIRDDIEICDNDKKEQKFQPQNASFDDLLELLSLSTDCESYGSTLQRYRELTTELAAGMTKPLEICTETFRLLQEYWECANRGIKLTKTKAR